MFSVMFFCYLAPNMVQIVVHLVYAYLTRIQFEYINPLEIGGAGGAIYLSYLVLHHSAWSPFLLFDIDIHISYRILTVP